MIDDIVERLKKIGIPIGSAMAAIVGYRFMYLIKHPLLLLAFIVFVVGCIVIVVKLVQRLLAHGNDHYEADHEDAVMASEPGMPALKTLKLHWQRAIEFLKTSHLKKWGDPLYVLPWFMIIGERGAGKTSALRSARLVSFAKESVEATISETVDCDWSFFEQAIVIDTAGRYASPAPSESDRKEWLRLLDLLSKSRKKEPLNGLVVALPSSKLLSKSPEALEAAGQAMRKRIDELMRALGAKFPVYLLITQCDRIPGMTGSFTQLADAGLRQTMGALNQNLASKASASFIQSSFYALNQRLKSLRLVLAHDPEIGRFDPSVLLFPDVFGRLEIGVSAFVRGAFQENLYQETPFLRGLYFSAVTQNGESTTGMFLNELFAKILPADRALSMPTQRSMDWWKKTMTMGVAAWLIFVTGIAGLMTYSFVSNLNLLREADRQFSHLPAPQGDLLADIVAMDRVNAAILSLKEDGVDAWLPSFGLHESARVKKSLEEKMSGWFWQEILVPFDAQNGRAMGMLTRNSSDDLFSHYVEHLINRISIIRRRLRGERYVPGDDTQPPLIPSLQVAGREANQDIKDKFAGLYVSSVFWLGDVNELNRELVSLQDQLKKLLAVKGDAPQWVIAWAKAQNSGEPVRLSDYWGAAAGVGDASVPAIFMRKDKALVDAFFGNIETAINDPETFSQLKSQYESWYRTNAFDAWHRFIADFPRGAYSLHAENEWQRMAMKVSKDDGPYFALLNQVGLELQEQSTNDAPLWLKQINQFRALKGTQTSASIARKGLQQIGLDGDKPYTVGAALADYRTALSKMSLTLLDASAVAPAVGQMMLGDVAPGTSSTADALSSLTHLKSVMILDEHEDPSVARIISGPYDFLWAYAQRETAQQLQTLWEKKVLVVAAGIPAGDAAAALLAPEGPAIAFAKDSAAPFVEWKPGRGYCPKESFGGRIPFTGSFFAFLNSSARISKASHVTNASVVITALGAESNPEAVRSPSATRLTLKCGKSEKSVSNHRDHLMGRAFTTATQAFAWTPACGTATLEIDIAGTTLIRPYPAPGGLLDFIKDFQTGSHTYSVNEFPEQASTVFPMGVKSITVQYKVNGAPQEIPDFSGPSPVPVRIVQGWN